LNDEELNTIEAHLKLTLPLKYRALAIDLPFAKPEHDWLYWFYTDPNFVIRETRNPLAGNCVPTVIPHGHFVFGQTAFGDLYILNSLEINSPVFCLSHETHRISVEYPSLKGYIEDWLTAPSSAAERTEENLTQRMFRWFRLN